MVQTGLMVGEMVAFTSTMVPKEKIIVLGVGSYSMCPTYSSHPDT
jgi:hypothetical protein